jgi:hypothetical protein
MEGEQNSSVPNTMDWRDSPPMSPVFGMPGRVVIRSTTSPEIYAFDQKRPVRAVALEPNFAKKSTKAFVCGGLAGTLVMYEKGWLGHKETVLHSGEGPIWAIQWRGNLIAWANDKVSGFAWPLS